MNNKLYIFITYTINNVGGCQLYMRGKALWLLERGWDVKIFYWQKGKLLIKDFENMDCYYIKELSRPAHYFLDFKRKQIVNMMLSSLDKKYCKVIVESHLYWFATWGELLSQSLKAKHLVYVIEEKPVVDTIGRDFLKFKYERGELAGIHDNTIPYLLESTNVQKPLNKTQLEARHCEDCILDAPFSLNLKKADYTIGLIGRLEKKYMIDTADDIIKFINSRPNIKFNVIYIGGALDGDSKIEILKSKYKNLLNANIYFTGYMFPIAKQLVETFDVCVSGAGAAWAAAVQGLSVIAVDSRDAMAIGVLGVNTLETLFSDKDKKNLSYYLEEIYDKPEQYKPQMPVMEDGFDDHFEFLNQGNQENRYDTRYLNSYKNITPIRVLCSLFSPSVVDFISKLQKRISKNKGSISYN